MSDNLLRYGVIGNPISHSKSPQIFNKLFEENHVNAYYTRILDPDSKMLNRLNFDGFNITSPFKSSILTLLDYPIEFETPVKTVNAVHVSNDIAKCYNFDLIAIKDFILQNLEFIHNALIIGSGDTAITSAYLLKSLNVNTHLMARNNKNAEKISNKFSIPIVEFGKLGTKYNLIICTIPLNVIENFIYSSNPEYLISSDYLNKINFHGNYFTGINWLIDQAKMFYHKITGLDIRYKIFDEDSLKDKSKSIIHFTGFMGAGKTTIGRLLASKLNRKFYDLDEIIEQKLSLKVNEIFIKYGVDFFRKLESDILGQIVIQKDIVLSTGGGTLLSSSNFNILKDKAYNIYLSGELSTLFERSKSDKRPLRHDDYSKFCDLFIERKDIYFKISDLIANSDNEIDLLTDKIYNDLRRTF